MSAVQQPNTMDTPIEELTELASSMRGGLGPRIKDRTHRLRTYRRCFPGSAGVRWLIQEGHAASEEQATTLGNAMLQAGLLHHVAYEHTFKDADILYKFTEDDEVGPLKELARVGSTHARSASSAQSGSNGTPPGSPTAVGGSVSPLNALPEKSIIRARSSSTSGTHPHAHRALLNAQIHSLNHKLERLASQHATLVAVNAQQQEAWEGQASADLQELKAAIGQLGAAQMPTQRQVLLLASQDGIICHSPSGNLGGIRDLTKSAEQLRNWLGTLHQRALNLESQVSQLQSQLSSQRTLAAAQQLLMALALLALGTNWGPAALWTLAAAAFAGLIMLLLGWGADEAPAHVTAHEQLLQQQKQQRQAGQSAAAATAAAAAAAAAAGAKGGEAGALHVLATASEGSECAPAPAPMAAATEELLVSRVFGSKTIDETAPTDSDFAQWPDGALMMKPSPKSNDMAVTRVERYESPIHVALPTDAHGRWEAAQARWAAVVADADEDDTAAASRDQAVGSRWVPAPGAGLPVNHYLIHFESDIFVGKMLVYIRGLPSSYEPYFSGKKRRSVLMLQGRFKRPLKVDDVVTGQEFARPYKNLKGCWLMEKIVLAFAKRVVSAMETGDMAKEPYITFPLLPLAHIVNVSLPGQEPPIDQATEDLRLWDSTLVNRAGDPMAADTRRRHFMGDRHRRGRTFSTEHVWTFYIWQQVIDVAGYYLDLLVQQYDIIQHLDGQPLQSMVKDKASGKYLFNMVYWNQRQIEETERVRALEAQQQEIKEARDLKRS